MMLKEARMLREAVLIHQADVPPASLAPTVTPLSRYDIIGSGTQIYLQYSAAMSGPTVRNPANYAIFQADASGHIIPGTPSYPIVAAVYDDGSMIETIRTRQTLRPLGTYVLAINAGPTGVRSDQGVALTGDNGVYTTVLTHTSPPDFVVATHNLHQRDQPLAPPRRNRHHA
jgi:hypothetical protein